MNEHDHDDEQQTEAASGGVGTTGGPGAPDEAEPTGGVGGTGSVGGPVTGSGAVGTTREDDVEGD
jgi:hypothetical protein